MSWEKVRLGDVTESCLGKMLNQEKNKGEYQPYLANINVRWGGFDLEDLPEMKFEDHEEERYGLKYGDLLICEGGEPGRCAIWKEQIPKMKIQKALHRVRVNSEMDYRYLFYWFLLSGKNKALEQYFTGATIKHMPGQKLKQIAIDKPPLKIQQKIADILSNYDNLIENNQKQIKLLEETAQRLYKEWFVDLHFPGYESTTITDGVPEGWTYLAIDEVYSIRYGKNLSTTQITETGEHPVYGANGVIGYYENYNCEELVTLITSRGNGSGDVSRTHHNKSFVTNNSFVVKPLQEYDYIKNEFVYWQMKNLDFKRICTGSAQPQLTNNSISTLRVLLPSKDLVMSFCSGICSFFEKIECLLKENRCLVEARDRLLPKLMSGEIEV